MSPALASSDCRPCARASGIATRQATTAPTAPPETTVVRSLPASLPLAMARTLQVWCVLLLGVGAAPAAAQNGAATQVDSELFEAVQRRDRDAVIALVEHGADVRAIRLDGSTPLAWAAFRDDTGIARTCSTPAPPQTPPTRTARRRCCSPAPTATSPWRAFCSTPAPPSTPRAGAATHRCSPPAAPAASIWSDCCSTAAPTRTPPIRGWDRPP